MWKAKIIFIYTFEVVALGLTVVLSFRGEYSIAAFALGWAIFAEVAWSK